MARVRLLATGGTIASRSGAGGRTASVSAEELAATAAPLVPEVDVEPVDVVAAGSFALQTDDLQRLGRQMLDALADGVDGVVITHGTDSMEESAFFLDLLHHDPRPVVLTGAQRPADSPAPDGPANLAAALRAAASPQARGCGVLLVFDGLAWPARGVQKVDTSASAGFAAPGRGAVLRITDDRVLALAVPHRPVRPVPPIDRPLPRVDVVAVYLGADDSLLRAAVAAGAEGIVLATFGAGNAPPVVTEAVGDIVADGVPVLLCSRVAAGPVEPLYGGGGGADLRAAGALFGGDLSPWQGRLLLSVALTAGGGVANTLAEWLT